LGMAEAARLLGDDCRLDRNLLRVGALDPLIAHPEYRVTGPQIGHSRAEGADDARKIPAENVWELHAVAAVSASSQPPLVIRRVDAGGVNIDHDLTRPSGRVRHLGEMQYLWSAMPFEQYGLHGCFSPRKGFSPEPINLRHGGSKQGGYGIVPAPSLMRGTAMITPAYVRMMAEYNAEMNRRLYGAAARLSDAERRAPRGAFWGSIHGTLTHILGGDRQWMSRFDEWPKPATPIKESAQMIEDFAQLRAAREQADADISRWAAKVDDAWLVRDLTWFSGAANREVTAPLPLLVTHFF